MAAGRERVDTVHVESHVIVIDLYLLYGHYQSLSSRVRDSMPHQRGLRLINLPTCEKFHKLAQSTNWRSQTSDAGNQETRSYGGPPHRSHSIRAQSLSTPEQPELQSLQQRVRDD